MMAECGIAIDQSSGGSNCCHDRKSVHAVQTQGRQKLWRMNETYVRIGGEWRYLYRAVGKAGNTVDFLLRALRDKAAAQAYFKKAIALNGDHKTVTSDKSGSNLAALKAINAKRELPVKIRQKKYLNNIVEQDHRAIKRRPPRFKTFRCARVILAGIEIMHMIRKRQMNGYAKVRSPVQ